MSDGKLCYWCHEPLPPLPEDATYVDEINHYIHDECRDERDENNRRMEELRGAIVDGTIDSIPEVVRSFVLERIKSLGFSRRCPCLYDPAYGFQGYKTHSYGTEEAIDDFDARNSVEGCGTLWRLRKLRPVASVGGADRRLRRGALGRRGAREELGTVRSLDPLPRDPLVLRRARLQPVSGKAPFEEERSISRI